MPFPLGGCGLPLPPSSLRDQWSGARHIPNAGGPLRRTLFGVAAALSLASTLVGAQQTRTITGRVVAEGGSEPLAGATISVVGTTLGALTAEDGRYRISVPAGAVQLTARRIGFKRRTVDVAADRDTVDVTLERDALKLEELVITGQGTAVARQNLANDVASVDAEALTISADAAVVVEGCMRGRCPRRDPASAIP